MLYPLLPLRAINITGSRLPEGWLKIHRNYGSQLPGTVAFWNRCKHYGGTGAAPDIAKKNIAMPIEYAITKVHNFLQAEGARDAVTLIASGGIRTAHDLVKAICLGADGAVIGTAELVSLECVRCGNCESGRGCSRGIASTDSELADLFTEEWATQRLVNMYHAWNYQLVEILQKFGMKSVKELVGRTDLLEHIDYSK